MVTGASESEFAQYKTPSIRARCDQHHVSIFCRPGPINTTHPLFRPFGDDGASEYCVLSTKTWVSRSLLRTLQVAVAPRVFLAGNR